MGKHSDFPRRKYDQYYTWDTRAGQAIAPFLEGIETYCEPCAGRGDLIGQLDALGLECLAAYDLDPKRRGILKRNVFKLTKEDLNGAQAFFTNPPWTRKLLHPMIWHLCQLAPTWFIFDSDWLFSLQSQRFMGFCSDIVPIGKMRWIEGSTDDEKGNSAWYRFDAQNEKPTVFHTRRKYYFGMDLSEYVAEPLLL